VGHVWVEAVVRNPFTGRGAPVRVLVDVGATDTVIPRKIAGELEFPATGKSIVLTARGSVELDECIGVLEVMGKRRAVPMLVSDDMDFALLGVTTLGLLRLEVDHTMGKLKESVAFLL